eukprot:jgi/Tetstr1/438681/TSEL_027231.t1
MSPKGHPELAGKGVEYARGAAKLKFRKINNCKLKDMHDNILKAMDTDYQTLDPCRKFARRSTDYRNAYTFCKVGLSKVEKMKKHSKAHRCTMHQDWAFILRALSIDPRQARSSAAATATVQRNEAAIQRQQRQAEAPLDDEGERILFNQLDAASGMWTVAIPTARTVMTPHELREHDAIADAFCDHCVHDMGRIVVRRKVDDLFQQAVPLGNTVPMDELKDLVPDAELSLPACNVVTGSYNPRSLKSTLLEFKTMRYGVKYTAVPRATAVDRFERFLLGDIQRGLAARDAAWHNTEPGQHGPLQDLLDMSEYTGVVFGTVGERSKGGHMRGDVTTTPGHEPKDAPPGPYLPTLVSRGARGCRSGGEPCAMARIWSAIAVEVGSVRGAPTACDSAGVSGAPGPAYRASAAALAAATALAIA